MIRKVVNRKSLQVIVLMTAMFLNPLGYDVLFATAMRWTGSYWNSVIIFYCLSALFFGLYFILSRKR